MLKPRALRAAVRAAVGKHVDLATHEVFLFGSEASGEGTPRSDIDIGIRGPHPLSGATVQRVRDELTRLRTLRTFDVVDFGKADPAFTRVATEDIERL